MAIAKILSNSAGDIAVAPATLNVTKPTGGTPGASDILVLCVGGGNGSAAGSYTAPAGWNLIGQLLDQASGVDHVSQQVWWAPGDVANLAFTKVGAIASLGWVMVCFTGCNSASPVDATGTPNSRVTDGTTLVTNAVTVATDQAWHVIGFGSWLGGTNSAPGFTVAQNAVPASNEDSTILYNTTPKSVGSTGTVTVTSSAGSAGQVLVGIPFALRPSSSRIVPDYRQFPKLALRYPQVFQKELINSQLR
jgi:hypothetical protein